MNRKISALLRLSTIRQTLSLLLLFMIITITAWGSTYWLVQHEMLTAVDARLTARMQEASTALATGQDLPAPEDGQTLSVNPDGWKEGFQTRDSNGPGPEMRFLLQETPHGRILLGENTEQQDELRDMLAAGMQTSMIVSLLATLLAGLWMAKRGQRRLGVINAGLAKIAQGDLKARIVLNGEDDLSLLATRINATTEQLESAMSQLKFQASNIAHDLRTPLARLRAQLETSLTTLIETDRQVTSEDLGAALEKIDHISGTFNALLRLGQIERGVKRGDFAQVDLGSLVRNVADIFAPIIEDEGQTLELDIAEPAKVLGDADLLSQLLSNVLQNAIRYGTKGQTISLRVYGCRLVVSDQGIGVPLAEREKVLQPLYQCEPSRQEIGRAHV